MCGIFFYDGRDEVVTEADVKAAFRTMVHRGPDNSGFRRLAKSSSSARVWWGCHRLAVMDPNNSGADQPIYLDEDGYGIVCNGQIYNFRELLQDQRHDVTALLQAFAAHYKDGHDYDETVLEQARAFFSRVDGDYACIIRLPQPHSTSNERLVLARDPVGVRPLFWLVNRRENAQASIHGVASEAKALLPLLHLRRDTNDVIEEFPPGHVALLIDETTAETPSFSMDIAAVHNTIPPPQPEQFASVDENESDGYAQEVRRLLQAAVIKRLRHVADDRGYVGVLLSGGLDSSLIACVAHEHLVAQGRGHELRTYSVSFEGRGVDAQHARLLVENLGIPSSQHTEVSFDIDDALSVIDDVVYHCETSDAPTIRAGIPMYILARHIRGASSHKVILSGEGSDEAFMGYPYFSHRPSVDEAVQESKRLLQNIHAFDVLRADRCMSAHNLELRVPFLDEELLRFVRERVPGHLLVPSKTGVEKALLRQAFRDAYPALSTTRIIDRMKEKMSHGCGLDYVPSLLRSVPDRDENTFYQAAFSRAFAGLGTSAATWTLERRMPSWATPSTQRNGETNGGGSGGDWAKHAKPDPASLTPEQLSERELRNKEEMDEKLRRILLERRNMPTDYFTQEGAIEKTRATNIIG
jgi:asparagine synthase (glutamine-hydrolysing)